MIKLVKEAVQFGAYLGGLILSFLLPLILLMSFIGYKSCNSIERVTGNDTVWEFWHGCFIEYEGDMLTREQYDSIMIARKGLSEGE